MGKQGVCLTAGPLLMLLGGLPLLLIYAVASMVPPELEGWDYWSRVLGRMFDFSDAGWASLLCSGIFFFGAGLFVLGLATAITSLFRKGSSKT